MFKLIKFYKWTTLFMVFITIGFVTTAIFLFENNTRIILLSVLPVVILLIFILSFILAISIKAKENILSSNQILSINATQAFDYGEVGVVIVDENKDIIWINKLMQNRGFLQFMGKKIGEIGYEIEVLDESHTEIKGIFKNRHYKIKYSSSTRTYIFKDVTDLHLANQIYEDESKVFLYLNVDNYESAIKSREEAFSVRISMIVKVEITNWAEKFNAFIKSISSDQYIVIMDKKDFIETREQGFKILETIQQKSEEVNADITLSIGAAFGRSRTEEISDLALEAMELAISRGGNQAVIKSFAQETEFFGGTTESKVEKTKVAVRVLARTLRDAIESHDKIFVVGHINPDFDCIGSGMAVVQLAKCFGKPAYQVTNIDTMQSKMKFHFQNNISEEYRKEHVLSSQDAQELVDKDSLVIVVDTNIKNRTEAPIILDLAASVIVIDHHRAGDDAIDSNEKYISTSASSVAEIMTETLFYSNIIFKDITQETATMMLAGIMVDTNNYRMRTSTRTFEASSFLKQRGAEPTAVHDMLQDTPEEFKIKSDMFASLREIIPGVVVLNGAEDQVLESWILAQVSESAVNIKSIKIAFVVGKTAEDEISISARSDGTGNVQKICEHFGGGGHFSAAGAKLNDKSLGEVLIILDEEIRREDWKEYLNQNEDND